MTIKQLRLIIPLIITYTCCNYANALSIGGGDIIGGVEDLVTGCEKVLCPSDTSKLPLFMQRFGCETYSSTKECYKKGGTTYVFTPCAQCKSPYTLTNKPREECSATVGVLSGPSLKACDCICDNCTSTAWSANGTGYEKRTVKSCDCDTSTSATCKSTQEYRCATGYYGTSSNGTSGCNPCPEWKYDTNSYVYTNSAKTTKARGTTSNAGTTSITGCHVVSGTYYDATGTFEISSNCEYKQ